MIKNKTIRNYGGYLWSEKLGYFLISLHTIRHLCPLLAIKENAGLRHLCTGFTSQFFSCFTSTTEGGLSHWPSYLCPVKKEKVSPHALLLRHNVLHAQGEWNTSAAPVSPVLYSLRVPNSLPYHWLPVPTPSPNQITLMKPAFYTTTKFFCNSFSL